MNSRRTEMPDPYFHSDPALVYSPTNLPGRGADLAAFCEQYQGCSCKACHCDTCSCLLLSDQLSQNTPLSRKIASDDDRQETKLVHIEDTTHRNDLSSQETVTKPLTNASSSSEEEWTKKINVLECNSECSCSSSCSNRVVQKGPLHGLEVFNTRKKGLGLRTTSFVRRGTFVCEYAGEVVGLQQAKERLSSLNPQDMNYIFVLKEHMKWKQCTITVIDPTFVGNIGRYINHSCDPNLSPFPVRVDQPVPKLALFANRDIEPYEELTFDYSGGDDKDMEAFSTVVVTKSCCCESANCRGYLPICRDLFADVRDSPD